MSTHKDTLVRQKEIVAAVRKLIVKNGSENVTIRAIAREVKVTDGALYRHFKSKKDILSFLIDNIGETLIKDIEINHSGEIGSLEILEKIILEHLSAIEQRKGVTFQVIAEIISYGDKELNKKVYNVINSYLDHIQNILTLGIQSGVIDPEINLKATAGMFFGMTQGLVNLWALSHYEFNLEEEYRPLWKMFLKSIRKPENS
jgi:AcrR family transcriptional regulator